MNIQGLQKMTLLDFPGHVACTVFLSGCDFRCQFCHNYELVELSEEREEAAEMSISGAAMIKSGMPDEISEEEFFSFLNKRHGLLDGVAITGGEPCLRKNLPEFIKKIKGMDYHVKLDTNGNHPEMLKMLLEEKLVDYVAMDIKNSPEKYMMTIGLYEYTEGTIEGSHQNSKLMQGHSKRNLNNQIVKNAFDLNNIDTSIALLKNGQIPYEFRTTVIRQYHEEDDFRKIGEWIEGAENYFLQAFTDREQVPNHSLTAPAVEEMIRYRDIAAPFVRCAEIRGFDKMFY